MISPSSLAVFALKFLQKSMMLTPCGPSAVPTGGAGVALPAAIWSFTIACTFFAIVLSYSPRRTRRRTNLPVRPTGVTLVRPRPCRGPLNLLHLQKVELDGRRPAEDRHHHLQRVLVQVHFVDRAVEAGE